MVPAARGLSVPRSVVWIATTITLGIAAVAAIGCGSAAEPPPTGPTEQEITARIDAAVARTLLDAEVEAERELRTQEAAAPTWIEVSLNPTPPDAYCEDSPHYLALEPQVFAETEVHKLRTALKPRSDGLIWVAVEDDAGWPYACHIYSAEDWIHNPDTGWYHSGPNHCARAETVTNKSGEGLPCSRSACLPHQQGRQHPARGFKQGEQALA